MDRKKLKRDLWNILVSHVPSRRIRRSMLRSMLGAFSRTAFCGLHVNIMCPDNVFIGDRSVVNAGCILDGRESSIKIAHDVDIGTQSHIWTLEHDPNDALHTTRSGEVVIEDHVWVASRVTILPGVTIGRGAVIAAGSIVTKDIEPMAIMAGVPAKKIGVRENPLSYKLNFAPRFR